MDVCIQLYVVVSDFCCRLFSKESDIGCKWDGNGGCYPRVKKTDWLQILFQSQ